jgi:mitochondrial fission process protein 1
MINRCAIYFHFINERNTAFEMAEEADMRKEVEMEMERVATRLNSKDIDLLMTTYDKDGNNKLTPDEVIHIIHDMRNNIKTLDPELMQVLIKFDTNGDGEFDDEEIASMHEEIHIINSLRYCRYTGAYASLFRYLAFTSDFGEALRPVVSKAIVNTSYGIAVGYCVADVAIEAYNLKQRGYKTRDNVPMSMAQCVTERSVFQGIASIALPYLIIHTTVDVSRKLCNRIKRFQKWGPSVLGLLMIPVLPLTLDEPVEHGIKSMFLQFGPWSGVGGNTSRSPPNGH